ncbi:MAG: hypothetical protein J6Z43_04505 [Clostridiales bacterium]|nr:hypothetical protein [Clostridiales bacterium]
MSPMEIMMFFFLSLAVVKAIKDSFEYWNRSEEYRAPVRPAKAVYTQKRRANITSL